MDYYSAIEKNEIRPFVATWMDLRDCHAEESKSEKEMWCSIIYIWNPKKIQMNLFTKQKQTHRLREQTHGYQVGRG